MNWSISYISLKKSFHLYITQSLLFISVLWSLFAYLFGTKETDFYSAPFAIKRFGVGAFWNNLLMLMLGLLLLFGQQIGNDFSGARISKAWIFDLEISFFLLCFFSLIYVLYMSISSKSFWYN